MCKNLQNQPWNTLQKILEKGTAVRKLQAGIGVRGGSDLSLLPSVTQFKQDDLRV